MSVPFLAVVELPRYRREFKVVGRRGTFPAIRRASFRPPLIGTRSNVERRSNCPPKLFDEGLGRRQIRKTPAIIRLAFPQNYMAVARIDMPRIVKVHDLTA